MPKLNVQTNFISKTLFLTLPSRLPHYNTEKTKKKQILSSFSHLNINNFIANLLLNLLKKNILKFSL